MAANLSKFGPAGSTNEKQKFDERCDSDLGPSINSMTTDSGCIKDIREQIRRLEPTVDENAEDQLSDTLNKTLKINVHDDKDEGICESVKEEGEKDDESSENFTDDDFIVYGRDADGDTLLHLAIITGNVTLAKVFIEVAPWTECLDIYNDKLRQTPLHLAVLMKQIEIVKLLLDNGANPEMFDHNGDTALHLACRSGNVTMVNEILKRRESQVPQNLDVRNYEGHTCLHLAVLGGHKKIADILLNSGADVNVGDGKSGATALHLSVKGNKLDTLSLLLEQTDIAIDKKMYNGVTPLMLADRRHENIIELLMSHNADLDCLESFSSSEEEDEE
jgi:ankyrin repeat protein